MGKISIIVPCYNEEEVLPVFYKETTRVLSGMNYDYELLFINDGSKDGTLSILKDLAQKDSHVTYLSFARNFKKEAAMYAGFCNAQGDFVAVMDADMQDPPSLLPQMMEILETGEYDSVATRRMTRKGEPKVRSFFARMFYKAINQVSDAEILDGARDFRLMKREMVDAIVAMSEYNRFSKGIFGWIGFNTYWLPYENQERAAGQSKWSFWSLFKYAIDGIINFSQAPLSIAFGLSIFMIIAAIITLILALIQLAVFGSTPVIGWVFIAGLICLVSGIQLLCLGIIGQYVAKTFMECKKRPHYIIADTNMKNAKKIK